MKKSFAATLITLAILVATACNNHKQPADDTAIIDFASGIETQQNAHGLMLTGCTDHVGNHAADLFLGSANDSLLLAMLPEGKNGFTSQINAFLLTVNNDADRRSYYLFDAGLGSTKGCELHDNLLTFISADEICAVFLTHLHHDHIGGLLTADGTAAFPNATIYLSQAEDLHANNPLWEQVKLAYTSHIATFDSDRDVFLLDTIVKAIPAPGHTPGHTIYAVDNTWLIVGDLLHAQDLQIAHPEFCARYDADPQQAIATRRRILDTLRNTDLTMCAAHCYTHFIDLNK